MQNILPSLVGQTLRENVEPIIQNAALAVSSRVSSVVHPKLDFIKSFFQAMCSYISPIIVALQYPVTAFSFTQAATSWVGITCYVVALSIIAYIVVNKITENAKKDSVANTSTNATTHNPLGRLLPHLVLPQTPLTPSGLPSSMETSTPSDVHTISSSTRQNSFTTISTRSSGRGESSFVSLPGSEISDQVGEGASSTLARVPVLEPAPIVTTTELPSSSNVTPHRPTGFANILPSFGLTPIEGEGDRTLFSPPGTVGYPLGRVSEGSGETSPESGTSEEKVQIVSETNILRDPTVVFNDKETRAPGPSAYASTVGQTTDQVEEVRGVSSDETDVIPGSPVATDRNVEVGIHTIVTPGESLIMGEEDESKREEPFTSFSRLLGSLRETGIGVSAAAGAGVAAFSPLRRSRASIVENETISVLNESIREETTKRLEDVIYRMNEPDCNWEEEIQKILDSANSSYKREQIDRVFVEMFGEKPEYKEVRTKFTLEVLRSSTGAIKMPLWKTKEEVGSLLSGMGIEYSPAFLEGKYFYPVGDVQDLKLALEGDYIPSSSLNVTIAGARKHLNTYFMTHPNPRVRVFLVFKNTIESYNRQGSRYITRQTGQKECFGMTFSDDIPIRKNLAYILVKPAKRTRREGPDTSGYILGTVQEVVRTAGLDGVVPVENYSSVQPLIDRIYRMNLGIPRSLLP